MNRIILILSVGLGASACGAQPGSANDGGTGAADASAVPELLGGQYRVTTDVQAEVRALRELESIGAAAAGDQWSVAEAALTPTGAATQLLARLDTEFVQDPVTSEFALRETVRRGLALGRAAMDDGQRDVAHETVGKILFVARGLGVHSELRLALAEMAAGRAVDARAHWDRAVVYYGAVEPVVRAYQAQSVPNVWGPMRDALSTDPLADNLAGLLVRGRAAIDRGAAREVLAVGHQAGVYLTRINLLVGMKYAARIESAVAAMMPVDPGAQPEGTYGFEGAILPYSGRMPSAAVAAARAHWRAAPGTITRAQLRRDAAAIYAEINARAVNAYAGATDDERFATLARMRGAVDALREVFAAAGQDPAGLQMRLTVAQSQAASGDHSAAQATLAAVQAEIARLASAM